MNLNMILLNLLENLLEVRVRIVEISSLLGDPRGPIQIGMIGNKHINTLKWLVHGKHLHILSILFFLVCTLMHVTTEVHTDAKEAREEPQIPQNWTYRQLWPFYMGPETQTKDLWHSSKLLNHWDWYPATIKVICSCSNYNPIE